MMDRPEEGSRWMHHSGRIYRVLFIANLPDNPRYLETVVYQGEANGLRWTRLLSDWHRSMTRVGERGALLDQMQKMGDEPLPAGTRVFIDGKWIITT